MKNHLRKKIMLGISMLLVACMLLSVTSFASSGNFSINASSKELKVGGSTTIGITANNCGGQFKITSSDSSVVAVSTSSQWIENQTVNVTLTAKKAGTATITITAADVAGTDELAVTGSKTVSVKVTEESSSGGGGSSNSGGGSNTTQEVALSTLKINGTTYQKKLSGTISINVEGLTQISMVPKTNNGSSCTIKNTTTGNSYTVSSGNSKSIKLAQGTNSIVVTLSSGKTYKVVVYNAEAQEEVKPNVIDENDTKEEEVKLTNLTIKGYELNPEFSSEVYSYELKSELANEIEELEITAIANLEGATIDIQGNKELKTGENIITIVVKSADGGKTATYQIKVVKAEEKEEVIDAVAHVDIPEEITSPRWNQTQKILITVFTSIIALMGIWYAVIEYKDTLAKKAKKEEATEKDYPYGMLDFKKEETENEEEAKEKTEEIEGRTEELKPNKGKGKHF